MNETQSCLSDNDLRELEHNQLSQQQLEQFEIHLTDCSKCRDLFDATDAEPLPGWQSEVCPALRETFDIGLAETRPDDTARHETYLKLLSPSDDPRMLGRVGNYEVVGIIGQGGMGVVFKAFETSLNRFVAIKMLLPHLTANGAARKRFLREAQAAAAVVDDHVLPIFGVDQWQETPYLVMKYSGGQTLQQRITQQGPLELKEVLRIGTQAAKGLAAAHAQGLVHRDVKPSNILLDGSVDRALLMDFGLARAVDDASITRTGVISGTPQYMSPEQVRADSVDARSDLFSLGSTLYAMCAGRPPFRSESAYGVMHRITHEEPTPICEVNSEVPVWMGRAIERLMSKTVEDRFESADEVAELLQGCLAHVQQPTTTQLPEVLASAGSRRGGRASWGKWLALAMCAFVLALGGILLVIELNKGKLVIECAADSVPVRVMQGDVEVEKLTVSKEGATIKIAAGNYLVEVDGDSDDIALEGNTVSLRRGGVETVKIQLKAGADSVAGGWTPPKNPIPTKILEEARNDRRSRNYSVALAKHLWYHENAHRIDLNSNDRLSGNLSHWLALGEEYPPALAKMRETRDATETKIRERGGLEKVFKSFQLFGAFNRELRDHQRTAELFMWLEEVDPKKSKLMYMIAEEALIRQEEYETCSKYVDPIFDVKKICFEYEREVKSSLKYGSSFLSFAETAFVKKSATLIEILVNADRKAEAKTAAQSLKEYVQGKDFSARLDKEIAAAMEKKRPRKIPNATASETSKEITPGVDETEKEPLQASADSTVSDWTPPENPDPKKILDEARADADSENYSAALAKHLWYHENAVRIRPSQSAVRLSNALRDWRTLGEKYPPALAKMKEIRDAVEAKMKDKNRVRATYEDFSEVSAFNSTLKEEQLNVELFKWIAEVHPEDASRLYPTAEYALMSQKEYKICGKYIDPVRDVRRICNHYDRDVKRSSKNGGKYLKYTMRRTVKYSATLIEILVKTDRMPEAQTVADRLKKFAKGKEVSTELEEAIDAALKLKPQTEADAKGADWTPPENPVPKTILDEATQDRNSEHYARALAKHVWYHNNAVRIQPNQKGVRLSDALKAWFELREEYPPALAKMREIRDALETKMRDRNRVRVKVEDFEEFAAFNRLLGKQQRTAKLFKWLDEVDSEDAEQIYLFASEALVSEQEYEICGKYTDPIQFVKRFCWILDIDPESSKKVGEEHKDRWNRYKDEMFDHAALVFEILVMNGRKDEARKAADSLKKHVDQDEFSSVIDEAFDAAVEKEPPS